MNGTETTWNKGKAVGQMKPLTAKQVATIRVLLEAKGQLRDIALFDTAIDSMLRSVDLLQLRVADVVTTGGAVGDEFSIQQQKTGKSVRVSLGSKTQQALARWIVEAGKGNNDYLFTGLRRSRDKAITREAYRLLVKAWVTSANLDPVAYSTHSLRRTKAAHIYNQTQNVEAVRLLLGQTSIAATSHYLGLEEADALAIAKQFEI